MSLQARRITVLGWLMALLALLCSCGWKTDPLIPASPRPEAVRNLAVTVRDAVAYLTWSVPQRNSEGKAMDASAIGGFRVYRAEIDRERRRLRYRQIAEMALASPAPATVRNGVVAWNDQDLQYGRVYVYRLRAFGVTGAVSEYSNEVRAVPAPSLAAPRNLAARAGDSMVTLTWDAVRTRTDGDPSVGYVGYNIYRGAAPGRQADTPVNRQPVGEPLFQDSAVENGKTYYYRVRAVDSKTQPWRESLDSAELAAAPQDLTPPAPPEGITVVPGVGRVFLTWTENRERDLAGYHVYRSVRSGGDAERLTNQAISRTTFSDETVQPGMTYVYTITAVDRSGNESQRSPEYKTMTERIR